jgi:predicted nucleotidyltransferase
MVRFAHGGGVKMFGSQASVLPAVVTASKKERRALVEKLRRRHRRGEPPKRRVPKIRVPAKAMKFAEKCAAAFGPDIVSVALVGSYARGDQKPASDIDVVLIVKNVTEALLLTIRDILSSIEKDNQIDLWTVTVRELERHPDSLAFSALQECRLTLYGQPPPLPSEYASAQLCRTAHHVQDTLRRILVRPAITRGDTFDQWAAGCLRDIIHVLRGFHKVQTGGYLPTEAELTEWYPVLGLEPSKYWDVILPSCLALIEGIIACERPEPAIVTAGNAAQEAAP